VKNFENRLRFDEVTTAKTVVIHHHHYLFFKRKIVSQTHIQVNI